MFFKVFLGDDHIHVVMVEGETIHGLLLMQTVIVGDFHVHVEFSKDIIQVERVENNGIEDGQIAEDRFNRIQTIGLLKIDQTAEKIAWSAN